MDQNDFITQSTLQFTDVGGDKSGVEGSSRAGEMHLSSLKPSVKVKAAAVSVRRIQRVGYELMQWSQWKEAYD